MATFATELALRGLRGHLHVEIGGIGRKVGATAAGYQHAYRLCTEHPLALGYAAADCDPYHDCLRPVTGSLEESIDLRAVTTNLGALEFTLLDLPPRAPLGAAVAHGWGSYLISDLLGIRTPGTMWAIAEDLDAVETNVLVDSTAGLTVGDALWLDAETVIVTQINAAPPSIDVLRGQYNSEAQSHWQSPRGEGILYDRPQYWRGRDVRLYLNLVSEVSGDLLPYAQAQLVWRGSVEDWECSGADGLAITFIAKSAIGRIDRCIGRKQYSGVVRWGGREVEAVQAAMVAQDELDLLLELADDGGTPQPPSYPEDAPGARYFHARLGDQLIQVAVTWSGAVYGHPFAAVKAQAYGLLGTPIQGPGDQDDRQLFREVLLTDPDAIGSAFAHRFTDPTDLEFCHPIAIALALITSTGAVVSGGATNTDYDVLPEQWGAGVAAALLDLDSFEDRMGRTSSIRMPWLAIGWDGKPIPLRAYLEQLLGPFGWFLYQNEAGLLALGDIAEAYPGETWPTIDESDLVALTDENGNATGYDVHLQGSLSDAVGQQVWAFDYDFVTDQPRRVIRYEHVQTQGRGAADDSDLTYEIRGLAPDPSAEATIRAMAMARARWFVSPLPRVTCTVLLDSFSVTVTKGIRLTCSAIPNPFTGGRGMTAQPAIVTSRLVNLSPDGGGTIRLELLLLPSLNVGLWSPSGQIVGYAAGAPVVLTLSANRFTSTSGGPDAVPDSDAEAFVGGAAGVGDRVMLVDFDGAVLCDNSPRVTATGVNTLTLDGAFTLAGVPVVPAAAWPWDHVVFVHWSGGGTPNTAYTATMAYHVAQADALTGLLPDGTSGPYVYGGT
ncbi:MAG: hypothetical protein WCS84_01490 [Nocardioides sp.]